MGLVGGLQARFGACMPWGAQPRKYDEHVVRRVHSLALYLTENICTFVCHSLLQLLLGITLWLMAEDLALYTVKRV